MSRGYSVAETARLVCSLRWACGRLSEMLEAWAREAAAAGGRHAEAAARLAELGRRLGWHRETLDGHQPDSERMAPWRQAAPADPALAEALDAIAAMDGPSERLEVAEEVFVPLLSDVYEQIGEHAAPHCDAALASAALLLRHDLGDSRPDVGPLHGGEGRSTAVAEAKTALAGAGGLVGRPLLRPE